MQHTAAEVIAAFHRDMIAGIVAVVLIAANSGGASTLAARIVAEVQTWRGISGRRKMM